MSLENAMDISVSGIRAERLHMELIASNLANLNVTRSVTGGPYRRKFPIFSEAPMDFDHELAKAEKKIYSTGGVRIDEVMEDLSPPLRVYNPGHPDADKSGYVSMPNISMSKEMVDMIYVNQLYNANITAFNSAKSMNLAILQLQ